VAQDTRLARRVERAHELAPIDGGQRLHRKQEGAPGSNPLALRIERPTRDQRVNMDMPPEVLLPGMQHQRKAGRPAQPARVGGERIQRIRHRAEQQFVKRARIASGQRVEGVRQGEHQMEIRHRQQLPPPRREPRLLGARLALRAVTVAAGMVAVAQRAATVAAFDMPA